MKQYRKAIAAALTGVVAIVALFVPGIKDTLTPEAITAIAGVGGTLLVYLVPNDA